MKFIEATVNTYPNFANSPEVVLTVEGIPDHNTLRYTKIPCPGSNGYIYLAEQDGYVSFYFYDVPGPGFGGREFTLNMTDGTTMVLQGPWSSRAGFINTILPVAHPLIVDVTFYDRTSKFPELGQSGACTFDWLRKHAPEIEFAKCTGDGDIQLDPLMPDGSVKNADRYRGLITIV